MTTCFCSPPHKWSRSGSTRNKIYNAPTLSETDRERSGREKRELLQFRNHFFISYSRLVVVVVESHRDNTQMFFCVPNQKEREKNWGRSTAKYGQLTRQNARSGILLCFPLTAKKKKKVAHGLMFVFFLPGVSPFSCFFFFHSMPTSNWLWDGLWDRPLRNTWSSSRHDKRPGRSIPRYDSHSPHL